MPMTKKERKQLDKEWKAGEAERKEKEATEQRLKAYKTESDPLYFKWQRGEATEQEWLDKVAEIKQRYPK